MASTEANKAYWDKLKQDPKRYEQHKAEARLRSRDWYLSNKDKHNTTNAERYRNRKAEAVAYLGGACVKCGGVFHPSVYDFHHTNPDEKEVDPSRTLRKRWSTVVEELDRCVLLCANCHRLVHFAGEEHG